MHLRKEYRWDAWRMRGGIRRWPLADETAQAEREEFVTGYCAASCRPLSIIMCSYFDH